MKCGLSRVQSEKVYPAPVSNASKARLAKLLPAGRPLKRPPRLGTGRRSRAMRLLVVGSLFVVAGLCEIGGG